MAHFFAAVLKPPTNTTKIPKRSALWLLALLSTGCHAAGTFSVIGSGRTAGSRASGGESCAVLDVHDGDTLKARCGGHLMKVRLHCIDAPELAQAPYGPAARDKLRGLVTGRTVTVKAEKTDKYGRTVGDVMLAGGESVELALVRGGYAAVYRKYCSDSAYAQAESEAKAARRGIWARVGEQQTPWEFRHGD
jgi:endonuclease YncB( thermonuclease family)